MNYRDSHHEINFDIQINNLKIEYLESLSSWLFRPKQRVKEKITIENITIDGLRGNFNFQLLEKIYK